MEHLAFIPKTSAPTFILSPGCASLDPVALGMWRAAMCGGAVRNPVPTVILLSSSSTTLGLFPGLLASSFSALVSSSV